MKILAAERAPRAKVRREEHRFPGMAGRYIRKTVFVVECAEHGVIEGRETHNGAHMVKALHNREFHAAQIPAAVTFPGPQPGQWSTPGVLEGRPRRRLRRSV